jgi:hypothetical protein
MRSRRTATLVALAMLFVCAKSAKGQNPSPNTEHAFYMAATQPFGSVLHVYDAWSTNNIDWTILDATVLSGAPALSLLPAGGMTSFAYGTTVFVFYVDASENVIEIRYDTSSGWAHFNLTTLVSGAPKPETGSPLTSLLIGEHGYIFYLASDSHVHELTWNSGGTWFGQDVTVLAKAPNVASFPIAAFPFSGSWLTVHFLGSNGHIYEVYSQNNSSWATRDLTSLSGAPTAFMGSESQASTTLAGAAGNDIHVFYFAADGHLHEIYSNGASWLTDNPTALSGAQDTQFQIWLSTFAYPQCCDGNGNVYFTMYVFYNGGISPFEPSPPDNLYQLSGVEGAQSWSALLLDDLGNSDAEALTQHV